MSPRIGPPLLAGRGDFMMIMTMMMMTMMTDVIHARAAGTGW